MNIIFIHYYFYCRNMTGICWMPLTCPKLNQIFFFLGNNVLWQVLLFSFSWLKYSLIFLLLCMQSYLLCSFLYGALSEDYRQNTFRSKHLPVLKDLAVYPEEDKKTIISVTMILAVLCRVRKSKFPNQRLNLCPLQLIEAWCLNLWTARKIQQATEEVITIKHVKNTTLRESLKTMEPITRDLLSSGGDQKQPGRSDFEV